MTDRARKYLISLAFLATGCSGVRLTSLTCDVACQDGVDPRVLTLVLALDGAAGLGEATTIRARLDNTAMDPVVIDTTALRTRDEAEVKLRLRTYPGERDGYPTLDGSRFTLSVRAETPGGTTNVARLALELDR